MNDLLRLTPLPSDERACEALASPRYELLPLADLQQAADALPAGAVVTVTCSPRHGLARTLTASETLAAAGFRVVPHLAARLVRDRGHLAEAVARMTALGIDECFVVGGDAEAAEGDFATGLALLEALAELPTRPSRIGIPAYPEGHPHISVGDLQRDLEAKARFADYAVTQLCFEAAPLLAWREQQRQRGMSLPVHAGLPGVLPRKRLLGLATRLGLGPSTRVLGRQKGLIARLLRPARYRPDTLLEALWPHLGDATQGFAGVHLYTFNQAADTRAWCEAQCRRQCAWKTSDSLSVTP
ncbi:methylenetetrahydrofolate reductase (NADPH) [Franzmannia pantelleriensis]|uniref:Methylenetetrahydrofolate reductase n=1 Tax=Franzmannia pantelleriensis TaxID=48727 RepID=A0A1G9NFQ1_9GAMM|nr:methylenetetrahydrofolate reductase [Halomonas pantelleriensis]SDL85388.1 methylenetetrahydrofolate reductase (NADPH) [Halomonas pantelleriensis]